MVATADFPQADRLSQVGKVAEAIAKGHHTDDGIENFIGLDSGGRQGRYYRQAAVVLGLITNNQNYSALTALGQEYATLATPAAKTDFLAQRLVDTSVFREALAYILKTSPNEALLKAWFRNFYPGENSTADRRFVTFMNYLRDASLVALVAGGKYQLTKYAGSVAKVESTPAKPAAPPIPGKGAAPALPIFSGSGVIQVDVDLQKLERANQTHWKLVDGKSAFLTGRGIVPQFNAHMDLFGESKGDFIIYEMKSVNDESSNLLSQVRKAVSQLYEYRFIYGMQARLAIVTNKPVSKANQWLVDYLEKDRAIGYQWTEDFQAFNCGPGSEGLAGPFCPK